MRTKYDYPHEKVRAAIETLADDTERIQERLARVAPYFEHIRIIDENEVPERLQAQVRDFVDALGRRRSDDEATQLVRDIFTIRRELEQLREEE